MTDVQQYKVSLKSMELKLNHSELKVSALTTREQAERNEKERLRFALAEAEENKILLEVTHTTTTREHDVMSFVTFHVYSHDIAATNFVHIAI